MSDNSSPTEQTRRQLLQAGLVAGTGALAGCADGVGETGGTAGEQDFPEFDPSDPEWPQPATRLMEAGFDEASIEELDQNFEPRDEPRYGDAPTQPEAAEEFVDYDPLVLAWTPDADPAVYEDALTSVQENIEAETDREVELEIIDSYSAMTEAFRSERLHISRIGAGNLPFVVNLTDAIPFAMPFGEGTFGNRLWISTQIDNDEINTVDDLVGREIAHTEPTSGSGHLEPTVFLQNREGIVPGEDYEIVFSGGHAQSIQGIARGDFDAGPTAGPIVPILTDRDELDPEELKVIWAGPFARPLGPICYLNNLLPEVRDGIETALFDYDYADTGLFEQQGYDSFAEIDYATHYDPVLQVHQEQGLEYTEEELD